MNFKDAVPTYISGEVLEVQKGQICCYECSQYRKCKSKGNPVKIECSDFDSIIDED